MDVDEAMRAVTVDGVPVRRAAQEHGVNRATLQRRLNGTHAKKTRQAPGVNKPFRAKSKRS